MMASPFVLLGILAFFIYRSARGSALRADTPDE